MLRGHPDVVRFGRFLAVGLLNTGVGFALFALLIFVSIPPQQALAISFVLGVAWNFFAHGRLVFGTAGYRRFPIYTAAYVVIYLGNRWALGALLAVGLHPLAAQAVILPFVALFSFLLVGAALTGSMPLTRKKGDRATSRSH